MNTETVPDKKRAEQIAAIREMADWLEARPWLPMATYFRASEQLNGHGSTPDEQRELLATMQELADKLGRKLDESLPDRTRLTARVGPLEYDVLVWHENGRPDRFDERDAELARLRAEVAALRGEVGLDYSREVEPADDPTPVSPARGGAPHVVAMTNVGLVDETPAEVSTLSAAIRFSEARREAFRLIGRTTSERLQAATLDLLHGQALSEDAERAQRADLRPGEQGRVTNPDLARFLAKKEEARREARHFLGLEESAKHYPVHAGPCWSDCNRSEHSVSESH